MLLIVTFVPSLIIGCIFALRLGIKEGAAAAASSAIVNAIACYILTH